jgi:ribosomal-protein-alanine N-acetyltransferase
VRPDIGLVRLKREELRLRRRGRGVATTAVSQLLKLAEADGAVRQVIAEILPSNIASSKVVSRLGFAEGEPFVDTDGETVVRWTLRLA